LFSEQQLLPLPCYKRTNGPSAEGQTLAHCGRCAKFQTVYLPHIYYQGDRF